MSEAKPPAAGEPVQIPIKADDAVQAGTFSNLAQISHGPETFQVDFLVIHSHPPFGKLVSRVILTPGHAKRLLRALQENLQRYEAAYGEIRATEFPTPPPNRYLQ